MNRLFTFLFITIAICAQSQNPSYELFGIVDGLPSAEVYDVYVDANNLIWVTTDRGISTYDGYEFINYSNADGLTNNTIFKILPDDKGRLWLPGYDGSMSIYENGKFSKSPYSDTLQALAKNRFYYSLAYDSLGNYYTHLSGYAQWAKDRGYFLLSGSNQVEYKSFRGDLTTNKGSKINVTIDKFQNTQYVNLKDFNKVSPSSIDLGNNRILFILPLKSRIVGSPNSSIEKIEQLFLFDNGEIKPILSSDKNITNLYLDHNRNIIICTIDGIYIYRNADLNCPPEHYYQGIEFSAVYQDKNHNYWFSSQKKGLLFIPTFNLNSFHVPIQEKSVSDLIETDDYLFYRYGDLGVSYVNKIGESRILNKLGNIKNASEYIVPNYKGGIFKKNKKLYHSNKGSVNNFYTKEYLLPNNDTLWGNTSIEIRRNGTTLEAKNFKDSPNSAVKVIEVSGNDIYYASLRHLFHISDLDYMNARIVMDTAELLKTRINDLEFDKDKNRWIASIGNGLFYQYGENNVIKFDLSDGLASNMLNTIHFQNDTTLWVGSNNGLDKIILSFKSDFPKIKSVVNYNDKDGLLSNFINDISYWNNRLWIASKGGLQSLDTEILPNNTAPTIILKSIRLKNEPIELAPNMQFEYDQNDISFTYRGISYNKPSNNFYRYKLLKDNKTSEWVLTDERTAMFTNLEPGSYTFLVSARNKNLWSNPIVKSFVIRPHFTNRWWFWLLCTLGIMALTYYIYTKRIQFVIDKNRQDRALQDAVLRTQIAELSTFRNQFNPHFIFNSLNSIQNYIFKKDVRQANSFLSKFSKLIRESLNLSDSKLVSIEKEFAFMNAYLELEFLRFPDKFAFEFHNVDDIPIDLYQMPPLLIQPVIENVVKHAFKGKEIGKLDISVKQYESEKGIVIIIEDDGTGIKLEEEYIQNDKRKSFGMKMVYDRIKLLNIDYPYVESSFTIMNKPSKKGTIAKFVIPIITIDQE